MSSLTSFMDSMSVIWLWSVVVLFQRSLITSLIWHFMSGCLILNEPGYVLKGLPILQGNSHSMLISVISMINDYLCTPLLILQLWSASRLSEWKLKTECPECWQGCHYLQVTFHLPSQLGWANHTHGQLPAIIPYSKVKVMLWNLWVLYEPYYYYHTASSILQFMPPPTCTITWNSKDHDVNSLGSVRTRLLSYSIQHSPNHAQPQVQ
jgi:hypothetical protein